MNSYLAPSRPRWQSWGFIVAVILIPILQLVQSLSTLYLLPAFWRFYADPPYMYLFNALSLGTGLTPQHVDHPGTSLQWLMAGVEHATFLVSGSQDSLPSDIAWNPEKYLTATAITLAVLFATSVGFFLWRVLCFVGSIPAIVAGVLIIAGSGLTVPWVITATPESLVATASLTFLGVLMPSLANRSVQLDWRLWILLGLLIAIGATAKIIMLPLLLLLAFVFRLRALVVIVGTAAFATMLILIPVFELLPRMFGWFANLARSSGRYGGESPTSMSSNVQAGMMTVTRDFGLVWIVVIVFVAVLVWSFRRPLTGVQWSERLPAVGVAFTAIATIAVSFKQSTDRDFMLLIGLIPTLAALTTLWIQRLCGCTSDSSNLRRRLVGVFVILTLAAVAVLSNYRSFAEINQIRVRTDQEVLVLEEASRRDGFVAHSFLAQNEFFALMLGSEWAHHPYSDRIVARFPRNLYYNAFWSTVYGTRADGSIGYLDCADLRPLAELGQLTFVLPGDFTTMGDQGTPGEIALVDGSVLAFDPKDVDLFAERLSAVPISGCSDPA